MSNSPRTVPERSAKTPAEVIISRTTVANILRHTRRYAGIRDWGGYELMDPIPMLMFHGKDTIYTLSANITLEKEGNTSAYDMVFSPSKEGLKR